MKRTLFALAALGAAFAAHAEQATQVVYPYAMPYATPYTLPYAYGPIAPLQVDENVVKAMAEYQQKVYEQQLAYQRLIQANTPAILRIPAVPQMPAFNSTLMQDVVAESEQLRAEAEADSARRAEDLQQSMTLPAADIDQAFADREQELDAALAGIQQRLDERQETLDVTAK